MGGGGGGSSLGLFYCQYSLGLKHASEPLRNLVDGKKDFGFFSLCIISR
jgi:hypothetical protein